MEGAVRKGESAALASMAARWRHRSAAGGECWRQMLKEVAAGMVTVLATRMAEVEVVAEVEAEKVEAEKAEKKAKVEGAPRKGASAASALV